MGDAPEVSQWIWTDADFVERLEPWSQAGQRVYLRGLKEPVTMSRRYGARLRDRLG